MKMHNRLGISLLIVILLATAGVLIWYFIGQKSLSNEDFTGEWKSVEYSFKGKTHPYDENETLIMTSDSSVIKKIRFGDVVRSHKGKWYLIDDQHIMLAFSIDNKTGEVDTSKGIIWEISDYTSDQIKIQSIPPGEKEYFQVTYVRK